MDQPGDRAGTPRRFARRALLGGAMALVVAACNPVVVTTSPEKATTYHGTWRAPNVLLEITPTTFVYEDRTSTFPTLLRAGFRGLSGQDILTTLRGSNGRLPVTVAPHLEGGVWKMTANGHALERR